MHATFASTFCVQSKHFAYIYNYEVTKEVSLHHKFKNVCSEKDATTAAATKEQPVFLSRLLVLGHPTHITQITVNF